MTLKYKLTTQDLKSNNEFQWKIGKRYDISPERTGKELCSSQVFHFYDSPELAVLMNPIHADISNPKLFEVECWKIVANDKTKGGCKSMKLKKEIPLPGFTDNQMIYFGIQCALKVYKEKGFVKWSEDWVSGKNRSKEAARAADWAAAKINSPSLNLVKLARQALEWKDEVGK